ncbi:MAG: hypothetical protein JW720_12045 [Sedimentisphaerales bacterium]|nr:hypothetical protein [Sedimentisphaerales bacterium]
MEAVRTKSHLPGAAWGSALILTVVLTSLLAIVGVLFLMVSRLDRMASSSVSQNVELDLAVDTVVGRICEQLAWDVPGTDLGGGLLPEYHDYPGPEDPWLAVLEPNDAGFWQQISDVNGILALSGRQTRNLPLIVVPDDASIELDPVDGRPSGAQLADADGDGIGDSRWIGLDGITSGRGERVYAAVRVIDNGGMLNVNTGYKFDPFDPNVSDPNMPAYWLIDGTTPLQVNVVGLADRPGRLPLLTPAERRLNEANLLAARDPCTAPPRDPYGAGAYETEVIWPYYDLHGSYTPFDISDELELRNRFLLNQRDTDTRIERFGWTGSFRDPSVGEVPVGSASSGWNVAGWFAHANMSTNPDLYDYRHIATTYSMDRIISSAPNPYLGGQKRMADVNRDSPEAIRDAIFAGLIDAGSGLPISALEGTAAQIAANIVDFRDDNSDVTVVPEDSNSSALHYGFECPCIYISEVAAIKIGIPAPRTSYAIELHKPYFEDGYPAGGQWRLMVGSDPVNIAWSATTGGTARFHVVRFEDPLAPGLLPGVIFGDPCDIDVTMPGYKPPGSATVQDASISGTMDSMAGRRVDLQRRRPGGFITVDSFTIPVASPTWLAAGIGLRGIQRDIGRHKCIRGLWDTAARADAATLGRPNSYPGPGDAVDARQVQAHPYLDPTIYRNKFGYVVFKNVGEIGMVFAADGYNVLAGSIEGNLRLDLQLALYSRILNFLTVVNPTMDPIDSDRDGISGVDIDEIKVPGRININTAPPYVLEQLPWMRPPLPAPPGAISAAVVAYRDKAEVAVRGGTGAGAVSDYRTRLGYEGFRSLSELIWVPEMGFYASDGADQIGFPDLTRVKTLVNRDGAADDFEERDLIFQRISNLISVRSDVFTAYVLVRIGTDGPQRRVIAILDRSEVNPDRKETKVKIRALHQVTDPW